MSDSFWASVGQADFMNWFMLCDLNAIITARIWEQCMSEDRVWGQFLEPCHWNSTGRVPMGVLLRILFPQGNRCPRLPQFTDLDWGLEKKMEEFFIP